MINEVNKNFCHKSAAMTNITPFRKKNDQHYFRND